MHSSSDRACVQLLRIRILSPGSCRRLVEVTTFILIATAILHCSAAKAAPKARGVVSDVPLILCDTCHFVAEAAAADPEPDSDISALDLVEALCAPANERGKWTRTIDLVEQRNRLRMVAQTGEQDCGVECATIALACEAVVDAAGGTEFADFLLKQAGRKQEAKPRSGYFVDPKVIDEWLCSKMGAAGVCDMPVPRIPKGRPVGPPFIKKSDKDIEMERILAKMGNMPGMQLYSRDDIERMQANGFRDQESDEGDDEDEEENRSSIGDDDSIDEASALGESQQGVSNNYLGLDSNEIGNDMVSRVVRKTRDAAIVVRTFLEGILIEAKDIVRHHAARYVGQGRPALTGSQGAGEL